MKSTSYTAINVDTQHLQLERLLTSENSVKLLGESESILQYCSTVPLGLHRSGASANICTIIGKMPSVPTKCDKPEPKLKAANVRAGISVCARCNSLAIYLDYLTALGVPATFAALPHYHRVHQLFVFRVRSSLAWQAGNCRPTSLCLCLSNDSNSEIMKD